MSLERHQGNIYHFLNKIWILCVALESLICGQNCIPQLKPSHFPQPIPPSLKVSQIYVTWHLPATHSYLISSQIERREIGTDWRDKFLVSEGQRPCGNVGRKMGTQSAMCWLYWLGACAKKSLSIPSFLLFTLSFTTFLNTGITATTTSSHPYFLSFSLSLCAPWDATLVPSKGQCLTRPRSVVKSIILLEK